MYILCFSAPNSTNFNCVKLLNTPNACCGKPLLFICFSVLMCFFICFSFSLLVGFYFLPFLSIFVCWVSMNVFAQYYAICAKFHDYKIILCLEQKSTILVQTCVQILKFLFHFVLPKRQYKCNCFNIPHKNSLYLFILVIISL